MIASMFEHLQNKDLKKVLQVLVDKKLDTPMGGGGHLRQEVLSDKKNRSEGSQFFFLNRNDVLNFLYVILFPEISLIDNSTKEELLLLINYPWSVPELHTRYKKRFVGES